MNQNELIQNLVDNITEKHRQVTLDVSTYLEQVRANTQPIPAYTALREPQFYIQVYSAATTDFNTCSNHRLAAGKLLIDLNSALVNLGKIRAQSTLLSSYIKTLNTLKDSTIEYQKLLEVQQRSIDSKLRYYSSVQYILSSPHFLQQ